MEMARRVARFGSRAAHLAERFWPGPLTIVLPLHANAPVAPLATAGLATVALRMPRGPMAELAERLDHPLVAPSANSSGQVSPTRTAHVLSDIAHRLDPTRDVILDGSVSGFGADGITGLESTIVDLSDDRPRLLRPGSVATAEIEAVIGEPLAPPEDGAIAAPGMLASHYAPNGEVRLDATSVDAGEFLIAFGDPATIRGEANVGYQLSAGGDVKEAARHLFDALHAANAAGAERIAVMPIPTAGLGEAIRDRLARAAAPRDLTTRRTAM